MPSFFEGVPPRVSGDVEKVIVVGAGASGLTSARILTEGGIDTVVLEARDRPGGRMDTIRVGNAVVDQGAAWIDGVPDNPLYQLTLSIGIETVDMRYAVMNRMRMFDGPSQRWLARPQIWAGLLRATFREKRLHGGPGLSHAESVDELLGSGGGTVKSIERYVLRTYTGLSEGADPERIGTNHSDATEDYGGVEHMPVGGYRLLVDRLAQGIDVRYGTQVRSIAHSPEGVVVVTDGGEFAGSHVLVTVPLPVLKSGRITFMPELPREKTAAIGRIGVGTFEKVILNFDDAFWRKPTLDRHDFSYRSATEGELPEFFDATKAAGAPTLVAVTAGSDGQRIANDAELGLESAMRILGEAFGDVPQPAAWHVTSWTTDPYALGSYSHHAVETLPDDPEVLAEPVAGRVLFAGEATQSRHQGYVGGAIESGVREARRILGSEADLSL